MAKIIKNLDTIAHVYSGQEILPEEQYQIQEVEALRWANNSDLLADIANGLAQVNNGEEDIVDVNDQINFLKDNLPKEVITQADLGPRTEDDRFIYTINRIPLGHTIYPTGRADHIGNGTYGNGTKLKLDSNTTTVDLQLLGNWYVIGGRVIWESASLEDEVSATLIAPATTGATNVTGDFNKVEVVANSGLHLFMPVSAGTGSWSMDLTSKKTNTQILKCTPVPVPGNTGFFDYNSSTNVLTPNYTMTGGYNLYDFDANLAKFCNCVFGRKQDGAESTMESSDVVGKLLFNSWIVRFNLSAVTQGVKCGIIVTTALKKSI